MGLFSFKSRSLALRSGTLSIIVIAFDARMKPSDHSMREESYSTSVVALGARSPTGRGRIIGGPRAKCKCIWPQFLLTRVGREFKLLTGDASQ